MQRKSKYLWAALAASLCLTVALLVMLGMSLRHQPLTGTYLCEGLSPEMCIRDSPCHSRKNSGPSKTL